MSIDPRVRWACVCALALAASGCQDYNFNPVGRCLIQPGTKRVTLSNVSSADVLFVVDDSGSMGGEQASLATNFDKFITNLDNSNRARTDAGLDPFDFHLAVTTTAVYWNYQAGSTCSSTCGSANGQRVCCKSGTTPAKQPRRCAVTADCGGVTGLTCKTTCNGYKGEGYCCDATNAFPTSALLDVIPCSREGVACGSLETHYNFGTCSAGVAVNEWPYPQGDFVSWTSGTAANPRVLHFDKELYSTEAKKNKQGFTGLDLVNFFRGGVANGATVQGNVLVGTCGSGQEQGLAAARRALEKALAGQQKDTFKRTSATPEQTWTAATRTATSDADWLAPNANSKLVLVFVGDEDDCSAPQDPSGGVVMLAEPTGRDACTRDASTAAPLGQKEYTVQSFVDYFTSLGRPVAAAFIESAAQTSCSSIDPTASDACTPGLCSQPTCTDSQCGGQAPATRFFDAAAQLRARGAEVVVGSICDGNFDVILQKIAELVKPPSGLTLPTLPAAREVTVLRIAEASGDTRKTCNGPLTGTYATLADAQASGVDWWFTATGDPGVPSTSPTRFVYINPQGGCTANPGETYSVDYLGQLPAGGCWDDPSLTPLGGETRGDAMCRTMLGGTEGSWTCYAGVDQAGACAPVTYDPSNNTGAKGTCICGARADNCRPTP